MKRLSFYSQKKRSQFLWIPVILFFSLMCACGPTKEELDKATEFNKHSEMRHTTIHTYGYTRIEYEATYYDVDSCEYIGHLTTSSHDFMAHSGKCKRCEKRYIQLMDSIVKENLKKFLTVVKR
jgi:hypothetical protein